MGYLDVQAIYAKDPFGLRHYWKGFFLGDLPDDVIDRCVQAAERYPADGGGVFLEEIHGAPVRVPDDAMAFNQRGARFNVSAIAKWESEALDAEGTAWAREFARSVEPYSEIGTGYVNYMTDVESAGRVVALYGTEKFERLRRIKRAHDPKNLFRFNQNIPPAA